MLTILDEKTQVGPCSFTFNNADAKTASMVVLDVVDDMMSKKVMQNHFGSVARSCVN